MSECSGSAARVEPEWWRRAACRGMPVNTFYAPDGSSGKIVAAWYDKAKAVCLGCPVMAACRADALATGDVHGVRGALTPDELRAAFRANRGSLPADRRGTGDPRIVEWLMAGADPRGMSRVECAQAAVDLVLQRGWNCDRAARLVGRAGDTVRSWVRKARAGRPLYAEESAEEVSCPG